MLKLYSSDIDEKLEVIAKIVGNKPFWIVYSTDRLRTMYKLDIVKSINQKTLIYEKIK